MVFHQSHGRAPIAVAIEQGAQNSAVDDARERLMVRFGSEATHERAPRAAITGAILVLLPMALDLQAFFVGGPATIAHAVRCVLILARRIAHAGSRGAPPFDDAGAGRRVDRGDFRRALLHWYDAHKRDLPWRRTRDPYAILVSEVMCQQTRVDVVIPFYLRWMARWPTVASLAAASDEEVVAAWSGLGYYRRARNLRAAAQAIHSFGWPERLQDLPGVGPYIAGAVASIAFNQPAAAVDGNVNRVLSRWYGIDDDVGTAAGRRRIERQASALLDLDRPGDWTQALMEFGAMVCRPRPHCDACPVRAACASKSNPLARPVKATKAPPKPEEVHFALIETNGAILLAHRGPGLLGGTWGLPGGSVEVPLEDHVREQTGLNIRLDEVAGVAQHVFSHRRWSMRVHRGEVLDGRPGGAVRWVDREGLDGLGIATAMRKAIAVVS